ncbi:S26 family signal peptidase [Sutcliffiella rhizosphaerae]|uniref:Peptidase S26 domain-containing protein n=1 Tax=Sutcliffiella rhizosphaerae TaxID=2880967 RepID=A0ABN8AEF0_9BACI|nr:S26 family signal peptidase [Sutcliffiella rhizosphaerae]CAG9622487.1 hypothetical protein BACCIP111883_03278 [Sutcliffiella rhizosphaerae]
MRQKLRKILEESVLEDVEITDTDKHRFLENIGSVKGKKNKTVFGYAAFILAVSLIVVLIFTLQSGPGTTTDTVTRADIPVIESVEEGMIKVHYVSDNMDRGNHDFYDDIVIIDPEITQFSRGDIVYYKGEGDRDHLIRIVGLEGESLEIKVGQVYIDNKMLDTFYGKAHRLGLEKEEYFIEMDKINMVYNKEGMLELFELNIPKTNIPEKHFFGMSDDWMRGTQGLITREQIIGKVVGIRSD